MNKALIIATCAHKGQFRRDGVTPYIKHIHDVADNLFARHVKMADIGANMHDNPTDRQIKKYKGALEILLKVS
jgi:(p)ppGpp synthase/HD superfamily hydrolase